MILWHIHRFGCSVFKVFVAFHFPEDAITYLKDTVQILIVYTKCTDACYMHCNLCNEFSPVYTNKCTKIFYV